MRQAEQKLWDTTLRNKPVGIALERVENGLGAGMPDVYSRAETFHTWIELKAPHAPKRESTRLLGSEGLSQEQINWHLKSARYGLITYVLIRDIEHKRLWLVGGGWADEMNDWTAAELDKNSLANNWRDIFSRLKGIKL